MELLAWQKVQLRETWGEDSAIMDRGFLSANPKMVRTKPGIWRPFEGQSELALANFRHHCQMWRGQQEAISIAIEGAGHVFWERYWPALKRNATEPGMLQVWLNDVCPLTETRKQDMSAYPSIRFLNKKIDKDLARYHDLRPSIVLVLVPDVFHLTETDYWCQPARWIGRTLAILVEKPLDRSLLHAEQVADALKIERDKHPTLVIPFDHYLAKVFELSKKRTEVLERIGPIDSVEFAITEPKKIEEDRGGLEYGMIFDMLCHALGVVSLLVDIDGGLIQKIDARAGKYDGARQDIGDTFNCIRMYVKSRDGFIEIKGHTGKAVGPEGSGDEKHVVFKGRKGMLAIEFAPRQQIVITNDSQEPPPFKMTDGYGFFLDNLIQGRYCSRPAGAVPYRTALNILRILTEARSQTANSLKTYAAHSSRDEILHTVGCW